MARPYPAEGSPLPLPTDFQGIFQEIGALLQGELRVSRGEWQALEALVRRIPEATVYGVRMCLVMSAEWFMSHPATDG